MEQYYNYQYKNHHPVMTSIVRPKKTLISRHGNTGNKRKTRGKKMDDDLITRYYEGEMCPECGEEGLVEVTDGEESYLECKKCGAISNNGQPGEGHTFI
jgi:hypothetical protein